MPVTNSGFYDVLEVMELHLEKVTKEDSVYFCTDNLIKPEKIKLVNYVLLVSREFSYIANIQEYYYFEEKDAPQDATLFTPQAFTNDKNKH